MENLESPRQQKRRPNLFRALGGSEPPQTIVIEGETFCLQKIVKHDSWAATSLYSNQPNGNHDVCRKVVCKFNRVQPIVFFPTRWLGRFLARRENRMYQQLSDLPNIARGFSEVIVDRKIAFNASAHEFIEGHPLRWHDRVSDEFFPQLRTLLKEIHTRNIAYVDMNKCENIIVDPQGFPHLIDFQISVRLPSWWPFGFILKLLQKSDLYHLDKHALRMRPELFAPDQIAAFERNRPWWIRLHRKIAKPWRSFRRGLLVKAGIRHGHGKPQSESFIEEGLQAGGDETKPVLQLYKLLLSSRYHSSGGDQPSTTLPELLLDDLAPQMVGEHRSNFLAFLNTVSAHDQVTEVLKLRLVIKESQHWCAAWVDSRMAHINARIASRLATEKSNANAA